MGQKHILHKQLSCKHCMLLSQGNVSWDIHGYTSELRRAVSHGWAITKNSDVLQAAVSLWKMVCYCSLWYFAMQFIKATEMKVHSHKAQHFYKTIISPFFFWLRADGSGLLKSVLSTWKDVVFLFANCLLCFLNGMNKCFHLTLCTEFMLFLNGKKSQDAAVKGDRNITNDGKHVTTLLGHCTVQFLWRCHNCWAAV